LEYLTVEFSVKYSKKVPGILSMNEQKAKFTWHYYVMAAGALLAMLAATLGSTGGIVSGLAIAVISTPKLPFQGLTRFVFYILFLILYVFAFPDPEVVREMMSQPGKY
jgi:hypothetical protein